MARILGIDPGSQRTGFGIVDTAGPRMSYVASGVIRTGTGHFGQRLHEIHRCVRDLVQRYRPTQLAIERVFVNRNVDSALKLGQARGAAICALADVEVEMFEYAPRQIKLAVVGSGSAEKAQVQLMIKVLLKLDGRVSADAADALATAICHAMRGGVNAGIHPGTRGRTRAAPRR